MILLTDDTIEAREELFFVQGIMVECDMLPVSNILKAAQQQVSKRWGVEAGQYRHHLILLDIDNVFPKLWEIARNIPDTAFTDTLPTTWWRCYEARNKMLNATLIGDEPRIRYDGWSFAFAAAMHIALYERRPYESGQTIWQDVATRGYHMQALIEILTNGSLAQISTAVDDVWGKICQWGAPEDQITSSS